MENDSEDVVLDEERIVRWTQNERLVERLRMVVIGLEQGGIDFALPE